MRRFLMYISVFFIVFIVPLLVEAQTLSGEEIMRRVDKNRVFEKIEYNGKMTIKKGSKILVKTMHSYAEGTDKGFTEFTNPMDRGTKYLKLADELWMYFPDAEEPVKISGHMLRESMMGSDFSYEDVMENDKLLKKYDVKVIGSEVLGDRDCYVLELNAKDKKITYARRKLWIDKENFVVMKSQLFALSGRLLKESIMENVKKYGDRYFVTKMTMTNKLLNDSSTTFELTDIKFDVKFPDGIFSRRSLEK